ncbi:MAG: hypothetical protein COB41_03530 [Proteobacteria bacterium]|nr:MAG: hypothetical protein COB41_03530 [Pseudomonadota bacterium]
MVNKLNVIEKVLLGVLLERLRFICHSREDGSPRIQGDELFHAVMDMKLETALLQKGQLNISMSQCNAHAINPHTYSKSNRANGNQRNADSSHWVNRPEYVCGKTYCRNSE